MSGGLAVRAGMQPFTPLQTAQAAAGNGAAILTDGYTHVFADITGSFTGVVSFQVDPLGDGANWTAVTAINVATSASVATAAGPGLYLIQVLGNKQARCPIVSVAAGAVTIQARAVAASVQTPASGAPEPFATLIPLTDAVPNAPAEIDINQPVLYDAMRNVWSRWRQAAALPGVAQVELEDSLLNMLLAEQRRTNFILEQALLNGQDTSDLRNTFLDPGLLAG